MKVVIFTTLIMMVASIEQALGSGCAVKVYQDAVDTQFEVHYMKPCLIAFEDPATNDDFDSIDTNEDGYIESNEWTDGFKLLLRDADENGDGRISRAEFVPGVNMFIVYPPEGV